jgi:hypothetical protein
MMELAGYLLCYLLFGFLMALTYVSNNGRYGRRNWLPAVAVITVFFLPIMIGHPKGLTKRLAAFL